MPNTDVLRFIATLDARRPKGALYSLAALFARLARAGAPEEAARIEDRIWDCWMSHDNAEAEAALDRATTDIAARRYDIAETRLARLVRRRPDCAEGWHKLGALHCMLGRDEESLAELRRALELEPRHFAALGAIGEILFAGKQGEGAALAYRAALRVHPHMERGRDRLALILGAG
ncbi:MAG: tetratricopeptide repeat protein [Burkholderiales bacterium]